MAMVDAAIPEFGSAREAIATIAAKNQIGLNAAYEAASHSTRLRSWRHFTPAHGSSSPTF